LKPGVSFRSPSKRPAMDDPILVSAAERLEILATLIAGAEEFDADRVRIVTLKSGAEDIRLILSALGVKGL
jgi:hypothetical protein